MPGCLVICFTGFTSAVSSQVTLGGKRKHDPNFFGGESKQRFLKSPRTVFFSFFFHVGNSEIPKMMFFCGNPLARGPERKKNHPQVVAALGPPAGVPQPQFCLDGFSDPWDERYVFLHLKIKTYHHLCRYMTPT